MLKSNVSISVPEQFSSSYKETLFAVKRKLILSAARVVCEAYGFGQTLPLGYAPLGS